MNLKTLKSLKQSIAHWKRIKENPDDKEGPLSTDCPLCRRFNGPATCSRFSPAYEQCTVRVKTGKPHCEQTPYSAAYAAWDKENRDPVRWEEAAQDEIDFLESLLPPETVSP